jgi:anaerobic ribonucleoside-triphosphate reductase
MENAKNAQNNNSFGQMTEEMDKKCHDCGKNIDLKDQEIKNGVFLSYDYNGTKVNVFKCNECYAKNPSLTNFQKCEVYSRVVGYIRPVQQWHKGKRQEYAEREEFLVPNQKECC